MDDLQGVIKALNELFQTLSRVFGVQGVWVLLLLLLVVGGLWSWWSERRKQAELERMLSGYQLYIERTLDALRAARIELVMARERCDAAAAAAIVDTVYPPTEPPKLAAQRGRIIRLLSGRP